MVLVASQELGWLKKLAKRGIRLKKAEYSTIVTAVNPADHFIWLSFCS
jgi:hypothetical protein